MGLRQDLKKLFVNFNLIFMKTMTGTKHT